MKNNSQNSLLEAIDNPKVENPLRDYEKNLAKLENILSKLENGEISLEIALKNYEQAVHLIAECRKALEFAEQKVQILLQGENGEYLQDFAPENWQ